MVKKGGFFDNLKNIHNETFLTQTLLVLGQFGVSELIPNIYFAYKRDFRAVEATKIEKITEKMHFSLFFNGEK